MKRANEWTRDRLAAWGLANAHLEPWGPFGRGWTLKRFSAQVIEPQCIPLIAYPKAWSPGTDGTVVGDGRLLRRQDRGGLRQVQGQAQGGDRPDAARPARSRPTSSRWATRQTDTELLELADAPEPAARGAGRGGRQGQPASRARPSAAGPRPGQPRPRGPAAARPSAAAAGSR